MPESVFVDTGYILALVNENDQHHAEALALSEKFDGQPIVVTDAVLLEIDNEDARDKLENLGKPGGWGDDRPQGSGLYIYLDS